MIKHKLSEEKQNAFAAIRIAEYRNLLAGRLLFIVGLRMLGTVVGWWIYKLTNDPFAIGLIGLCEVIPALSLALYAGHVIDISEKRKMLLRGVVLYLICALMLFGISSAYVNHFYGKSYMAFGIYGVIFLTGIIRAFTGPVFATLIPAIVPKEHMQNAITWNQGTWLSASVTGHALGGLMIAAIGIHYTFGVIAILILSASFFMYRLTAKPALIVSGEKKTWASIMEGVRFVFRSKEILGAISLDLFAVLFGGAVAMVPVFASDILKVGPQGFGLLNAAIDIGAILIVIWLTFFPIRHKQGRILMFAVAGFGLCIITFALSGWFWLSFVALLIAGMLDGISVVVRGTILQLKTPDQMRGRVMSVNSMFINSSNELGQFESGIAAKLLGVIPSVIFGGGMTILVVIITWIKAPTLRKMEY
ncbi:MAG: MFS transporter [Sphingobacteriales bacterium]|nr:MAG: MFS transporter [Sphingobacteriales bacterium]